MADFDSITIIFNPNSTGNSPDMARELADQLQQEGHEPHLKETERAGHATDLAYEAATGSKRPLIISVSGDGGYHEVINGALKAVDKAKASPVCAVLPGGNANDHYSHVYDRPLLEAIQEAKPTKLDVLRVETEHEVRYAHSYAGLGLTPLVAVELNKHDLSAIKEAWLAIRTFWKFRPFTILIDGQKRTFDSVILANIGIMAKHLTIDQDSDIKDGKFEVLYWTHTSKRRLIWQLLKAAAQKSSINRRTDRYSFTTIDPMPMQLDGEVLKLRKNQTVNVTCEQQKLSIIR